MLVISLLILCLALIATPLPHTHTHSHHQGDRARLSSFFTEKMRAIGSLRERIAIKKTKTVDLGLVVTEVATRLRSGANPEEAWYQSIANSYGDTYGRGIDEHGVPHALRALWKKPQRLLRKKKTKDQTQLAIPAAIAVCRLSYSSGAPMAEVLDSCASGITEAAEAESARNVALAGPQTSAQMLAWLPLIGVFLGSLLGAAPLHFLFSTTAGLAVLFLGLIFEISGIVWVRKLSAQAARL